MRLLLDTHTLVWAMGPGRELPLTAQRLLLDPGNNIFYSVISIFEIAAKRAAARRSAPKLSAERATELAEAAGYVRVNITAAHAIAVETIAPFHPDPFDKLLLAQAQIENMRLLTRDESVAAYDDRVLVY